jgi:hypothetical protein
LPVTQNNIIISITGIHLLNALPFPGLLDCHSDTDAVKKNNYISFPLQPIIKVPLKQKSCIKCVKKTQFLGTLYFH